MNSNKVFLDSSGFFALFASNDPYHSIARNFIEHAKTEKLTLHTTDYVLDETFTLLKARKITSQIKTLSNLIDKSKVIKIHWMDSDLFKSTEDYFIKHEDKNYSFTDCLSFIVMKKYTITQSLTTDNHFLQAGFKVIN